MPSSASIRNCAPAAVLAVVFVLQCAWFIRTQSLTFDEPIHIAEGLDAWRHHRFQEWNDHPPLARLWCTLPLFGDTKFQVDASQLIGPAGKISDIRPGPEAIAWRARSMTVLLGLILAWVLWECSRRMFSSRAANMALALFVFSPALVAHFSLATTDGVAALAVFATAVALLWWKQDPGIPRTFAFGVVLGFLLLAKFSTPPMFILAVGWMLLLKPGGVQFNPLRWNWGKVVLAIVVAGLVVWAGYFFHVSRVQVRNGNITANFANRSPFEHKVNFERMNLSLPLPAGEYFEGLWRVTQANKMGHPAFFLGTISQRGGFRLYYPVTVMLKWPLVVLVLFVIASALLLTRKIRAPEGLGMVLSFPVLYFLLAMFARFDIGDRHVLPVYPFVLLVAAGVCEAAVQRRWTRNALLALLVLFALDTLRCAPDYLTYFNIFVSPAQSYRLLTDSNLDWGQGLIALRSYQAAHPGEDMWLAYFGSVDPAAYGIKGRPLAPEQRVHGTVVVSATDLSGQYLENHEAYRWVLQYPRVAVIDGNMHVFKVP